MHIDNFDSVFFKLLSWVLQNKNDHNIHKVLLVVTCVGTVAWVSSIGSGSPNLNIDL